MASTPQIAVAVMGSGIELKTPDEYRLHAPRPRSSPTRRWRRWRRRSKPGISLEELDAIGERTTLARGGICAFKGLYGFPKNVCISVNEQVVHGIPTPPQAGRGRPGQARLRRHPPRLLRRLRPHRSGGQGLARGAQAPGRDAPGAEKGIAAMTPATASATIGAGRRRPRGSLRLRQSSATTSATASARSCTRSRRCPLRPLALSKNQPDPRLRPRHGPGHRADDQPGAHTKWRRCPTGGRWSPRRKDLLALGAHHRGHRDRPEGADKTMIALLAAGHLYVTVGKLLFPLVPPRRKPAACRCCASVRRAGSGTAAPALPSPTATSSSSSSPTR